MRIFENANYDFIGNRKIAYLISTVLIVLGMIFLVTRGIEVGIDFQGGTEFVVQTDSPLPVTQVREALGSLLEARGAFEGARVLDLFAGTGALALFLLLRIHGMGRRGDAPR